MTLALEARNLSLERFFGDIRLPGTGLSGGATLSIALRWGEGGLEGADGGATLEIKPGPATSLVRGRFGIPTGGGGTLSIVDGRIGFDGTIFRFPASSLELTGGLRIGQWTPDFDFRLRSRDLVEVDRLFQNFTAASGGRPAPLGLGGSAEADGHIARSWGNPVVTAQISAENASYDGVLFGSVRGTTGMEDGAFLFHPLRVYEGSATLSLEGMVRYRARPDAAHAGRHGGGQGLSRRAAARLSRSRVSDRRAGDRDLSAAWKSARLGLGIGNDDSGRGRGLG